MATCTYPFYKRLRDMSGHTVAKSGAEMHVCSDIVLSYSLALQLGHVGAVGRERKATGVYRGNTDTETY